MSIDLICGDCLKRGINLYAKLPLPGGNDPCLRVFEAYGMAAGKDRG